MNRTFIVAVWIAALAFSPVSASAQMANPAGAAQTGDIATQRKRIEAEIKSATEEVRKYANLVRDFKGGKVRKTDPRKDACLKTFDGNKALSAAAPTKALYALSASRYQGCMALQLRSSQVCDLLKPAFGADSAETRTCERLRVQFMFDRTLGGSQGQAACMELLTSRVTTGMLQNGFPADLRQPVCDVLEKGGRSEKVVSILQSSATPIPETAVAKIKASLDTMVDSHHKCPADCKDYCCDAVATARARVAGDTSLCGSSDLCRAAFGVKNPCDRLYDQFADDYCTQSLAPTGTGQADAFDPYADLKAANVAASAAVTKAMGDADGLEPRADEDNTALRDKARAVRKELNEIPKVGDKPSGKKPASLNGMPTPTP